MTSMTTGRAPSGPRSQRLAKTVRRAGTGWMFIGPATFVILGLSAFPAGWAFYISQLKWDGIRPPRAIGFSNYSALMADPDLWSAIRHTVLYTALFVPTSVVVGMLLAMALNRNIRFIGVYRTCVFVPFVASAAATGILANYIFDPQFGFANNVIKSLGLPPQAFLEDGHQAMVAIALMSLWAGLGFTVVVYLAALQDIPKDLIEAAMVDGANRLHVFRYIVWPELRPVTVFVSIWQLIGALQLFDIVFTTTRGGPVGATKTIVYYLYEQAFQQFRYGYGSAIAYVLFAFTLLITIAMFVYSRFAKVQAF